MLIFVEGRQRPEYVPWPDVEQVDFDRPRAMYPPLAGPLTGRTRSSPGTATGRRRCIRSSRRCTT
jgi:hypothetical protein